LCDVQPLFVIIDLSVPIRSLYLILPYLPLTEEEVQAIAYHDGQYVDDNKSSAIKWNRYRIPES